MGGTEGSKMKITDLNIICLEEIFEYLDLLNLLNVADSNKRLNIAACFVFRRKHGKKEVNLQGDLDYSYLGIRNEYIPVYGAVMSLRFLRCFGCVTSKLCTCFRKIPQHKVDKICFYINEYCAESLIELHIIGRSKDVIIFTHIQRPFLNIETLKFEHCYLGRNVMQFNKWFPKMRHLELSRNKMVEKECIEMNFPNLRYLEYWPIDDNENFVLHFENIIRLNPNLQRLYLNCWSVKLLQNISKYIPQLEELAMSGNFLDSSEPDYISGQVRFKSLKKFQYWCESEILSKINFLFDQLEELHVAGIKFNDLLTFVTKHSTIKKLELNSIDRDDGMSTENALQVAKALPFLSELHLWGAGFHVDGIIRFVDELKQVKKIRFHLYHRSEVDDLRAKLGNKWKVSVNLKIIDLGIFITLQCDIE